jgi:RNA polymerase sigma-70 factor (ECF subfamily)
MHKGAPLPDTPWSLISRLRSGDAAQQRAALEEVCRAYHYPLYCYIRRKGLAHHDAEDALHDFLAKLLRNESLATADAEKGRLRAFLLVALQRYLVSWQRARIERSPSLGVEIEDLLAQAEQSYQAEDAGHRESPDRLYDRQWALQLIGRAVHRLRTQYTLRGRLLLFETLQPVLLRGGSLLDEDTAALAAAARLTPGALRIALLRMLRDFQAALRVEILHTVGSPAEAREELAALMASFRNT